MSLKRLKLQGLCKIEALKAITTIAHQGLDLSGFLHPFRNEPQVERFWQGNDAPHDGQTVG